MPIYVGMYLNMEESVKSVQQQAKYGNPIYFYITGKINGKLNPHTLKDEQLIIIRELNTLHCILMLAQNLIYQKMTIGTISTMNSDTVSNRIKSARFLFSLSLSLFLVPMKGLTRHILPMLRFVKMVPVPGYHRVFIEVPVKQILPGFHLMINNVK